MAPQKRSNSRTPADHQNDESSSDDSLFVSRIRRKHAPLQKVKQITTTERKDESVSRPEQEPKDEYPSSKPGSSRRSKRSLPESLPALAYQDPASGDPPGYAASARTRRIETDLERRIRRVKEEVLGCGLKVTGLFQQSWPHANRTIMKLPALDFDLLHQAYRCYSEAWDPELGARVFQSMVSNEVLPLLKACFTAGSDGSSIASCFPPDVTMEDWGYRMDLIARHAYNHGSQAAELDAARPEEQALLGRAAQTVALIHRRCQLVRDTQWEHPTKSTYFGYIICTLMLLTAIQDLRASHNGFFAQIFRSFLANPMTREARRRWSGKYLLRAKDMEDDWPVVCDQLFVLVDATADEVELNGSGAASTVPFTCQESLVLLEVFNVAQTTEQLCWEEVSDLLPGRTNSECCKALLRLLAEQLGDSGEHGSGAGPAKRRRRDPKAGGNMAGVLLPTAKKRLMNQRLPGYDESIQSTSVKQEENEALVIPQSDIKGGAIVEEELGRENVTEMAASLVSAKNRVAELEAAVHDGRAAEGRLTKSLEVAGATISTLTTKVANLEKALAEAKKPLH
ncbi:hypothetical protein LTR17_021593 [Elasticomyces elasticus]|nr:hypothetical protein LTR17_021593 [Elasticomyces elasticus]